MQHLSAVARWVGDLVAAHPAGSVAFVSWLLVTIGNGIARHYGPRAHGVVAALSKLADLVSASYRSDSPGTFKFPLVTVTRNGVGRWGIAWSFSPPPPSMVVDPDEMAKKSIRDVGTLCWFLVPLLIAFTACGIDWHKLIAQAGQCAPKVAAGALDSTINALADATEVQLAGGNGFDKTVWEARLGTIAGQASWEEIQCAAADLLDDVANGTKAAALASTDELPAVPATFCRRGRHHARIRPDAKPLLEHVFHWRPPSRDGGR